MFGGGGGGVYSLHEDNKRKFIFFVEWREQKQWMEKIERERHATILFWMISYKIIRIRMQLFCTVSIEYNNNNSVGKRSDAKMCVAFCW